MNEYKLITKAGESYYFRSRKSIEEVYRALQKNGWVRCYTVTSGRGELTLLKRKAVIAVEKYEGAI